MIIKELIEELKKYPEDLEVMAAGERAERVLLEECQGNSYIRIFEPWNAELTGRYEYVKRVNITSSNLERLQEILKQELFFDKSYSYGSAVHFEPPEKTDAEKIAETPINIDPLGVHDFKNVERLKKL